MQRRCIVNLWIGSVLLLTACSPALATRIAELSTPTAAPHNPGVADILLHRPAAGEPLEVDAYFSGAGAMPASRPPPPPGRVACPWPWALTDRPLLANLNILNGTRGNPLPADSPVLIAASPEETKPGVVVDPQLPYHGRLRGHLGDPAFAGCPSADRIFLAESVVTVYEKDPPTPGSWVEAVPKDYASWPRYHDARFGYNLPYPPDWEIEHSSADVILLRGPQWCDYPVTVRVHAGETHLDQFEMSTIPPLLRGKNGWSAYQQGIAFGEGKFETQHLDGFTVNPDTPAGQGGVAALLNGSGHTYEVSLRYPTGFEASQPLLTIYTTMVEGFRLDVAPGPSPTPPIKQILGQGPFLSREQAFERVRAMSSDVQLLEAELLSEAQAREAEGTDACSDFNGHPDGVWRLTVRGNYDGMTRTMRLLLDAATGKQLCGQEIPTDATPYPTLPPGVTATPAPTATAAPVSASPLRNTIPAIEPGKLHVVKTTTLDVACNNLVMAPDDEHFVCNGSDIERLWYGSLSKGIEKSLAKSGWAYWLPDGKQLLYSEIIQSGLFPAAPEVYLLDAATGDRTLVAAGWSAERYPTSGNVFYFTDAGLVEFYPASQTSGVFFPCSEPIWKLMLYHCGAGPAARGPVMNSLAVSPDGGHIAFLSADGKSELLHLGDVSSGQFITITQTSSIKVNLTAAWSPDGRRLAYGTSPHGTEPAQLWIVNADGTSPKRLDRNKPARMYGSLDWMPDGQTLVASMIDGETALPSDYSNEAYSLSAYQIKAINSLDGTSKELTKGYAPVLFAGGRKLLFTRGPGPFFVADLGW